MLLNIHVTREQNKLVRKLIESEVAAYKNWIVTALEMDKVDYAKKLVEELKAMQEMLHIFKLDDNMIEKKLEQSNWNPGH